MQRPNQAGVSFVAQQDGPVEKVFKWKVSGFLNESGAILTAYLCRVHYGNPDQVSVAVCLASPFGEELEIVEGISKVFQEMFGKHEHVDIMFIDADQQLSISQICNPFYKSPVLSKPCREKH